MNTNVTRQIACFKTIMEFESIDTFTGFSLYFNRNLYTLINMKVSVRFFASLRESIGIDQVNIDLPEHATVTAARVLTTKLWSPAT